MRLAVNLRQFFQGKIGGMENYVRHVIGGIADRPDIFPELTIFVVGSEIPHVRQFAPRARVIGVSAANAVAEIEQALNAEPYDVLFCPLLVLEPLQSKIPSAVTIPDLQHEYFPEFFNSDVLAWRKRNYRPSVHLADAIFTLSEYSKATLVEKLGAEASKVSVIDLDVDPEFREPSSPAAAQAFQKLNLPPKYIYYPANYWPHKNHANLLRAVDILRKGGHPDISLVLTGSRNGAAEIQRQAAKLGLQRHVRLLDYQPRDVIAEIYRHARVLAFISRFEGFGIPILEAFHSGCPVVCSASCSCPEIAGDAALLVDETEPAVIAGAVARVLEDAALARELKTKGAVRAQHYSWSSALDVTIERLLSVPDAHPRRCAISVDSWPVVSITTPSYNMARFLEETIQSVLAQDYPHIEYLVMDGGSKDGTLSILEKYNDRLRYVSQPDGGQAEAINRGCASTSGPIFTFLNADDTYLPGAVATAVRALRNNPYAGMIYGNAQYVNEAGQFIGDYPTHSPDLALLNRNCYICQPASFMWRHAFEEAGWMNAGQHFVLDYDLWMRMAKVFPMVKIDEYLATSRMYGANKTIGQRDRVYREILQSVKAHFGYVPFDWTFGYACYLADRKDQFFEQTEPSRIKYFLSLLLGIYYNPGKLRRYVNEWAGASAVERPFRGRWADGWISERFQEKYEVPKSSKTIVVEGKHWGTFSRPLVLAVHLNRKLLGTAKLEHAGPFRVEFATPPESRRKAAIVDIAADQTFRPTNGDLRRLSCIIDTIRFES